MLMILQIPTPPTPPIYTTPFHPIVSFRPTTNSATKTPQKSQNILHSRTYCCSRDLSPNQQKNKKNTKKNTTHPNTPRPKKRGWRSGISHWLLPVTNYQLPVSSYYQLHYQLAVLSWQLALFEKDFTLPIRKWHVLLRLSYGARFAVVQLSSWPTTTTTTTYII